MNNTETIGQVHSVVEVRDGFIEYIESFNSFKTATKRFREHMLQSGLCFQDFDKTLKEGFYTYEKDNNVIACHLVSHNVFKESPKTTLKLEDLKQED
jgi:hypothetical protein